MTMTQLREQRSDLVARYNDAFRKFACLGIEPGHTIPGRLVVTPSVMEAGDGFVPAAIRAVGEQDTFDPENDPDGRHDFGAVTIQKQNVFWKIHLYEEGSGFRCGAETPEDPKTTVRVLTIMLASDW